jgi:hypothetical protein
MDRYGNVNFIRDIFTWLKNKGEKDIFLFKKMKLFPRIPRRMYSALAPERL